MGKGRVQSQVRKMLLLKDNPRQDLLHLAHTLNLLRDKSHRNNSPCLAQAQAVVDPKVEQE